MSLYPPPEDLTTTLWSAMPEEYRLPGKISPWAAANKPGKPVDCFLEGPSFDLNKDESILYVAMTRGNAIWRLPLMDDGGVSKVGLFVQLSGGMAGPDGLAIDEDDRLLVAHAGHGTVWVFSRFGEPVYRLRSDAGMDTTNIAFGGPDGKDLYIVESELGKVLERPMDVPGKLMYSHAD
jgi:gluconolactonase